MEEYRTVRKSGRTHVSPRFSSLLLLSSRQSGATCQSGEGGSEVVSVLWRWRERAGGRGSGSLSIKSEAARRWAVGCHSRRHFPPPLSALLPHHLSLSSSACHFKWLFPPYSLSLFVVAPPSTHTRPPPRSTKKRAHKKGAEWAKKHFPYYPPMGFQLSFLVCTSVYSKLDKNCSSVTLQ